MRSRTGMASDRAAPQGGRRRSVTTADDLMAPRLHKDHASLHRVEHCIDFDSTTKFPNRQYNLH